MKKAVCSICRISIDLTKDSYVHLIDYREGKFEMEGLYHNKCWQDRFSGKKDVAEAKSMLMNLLNGLGNFNSKTKEDSDY